MTSSVVTSAVLVGKHALLLVSVIPKTYLVSTIMVHILKKYSIDYIGTYLMGGVKIHVPSLFMKI